MKRNQENGWCHALGHNPSWTIKYLIVSWSLINLGSVVRPMGEANCRIKKFWQNCHKRRGFKADKPSPRAFSVVPAVEIGIMNVRRGNNQMRPSLISWLLLNEVITRLFSYPVLKFVWKRSRKYEDCRWCLEIVIYHYTGKNNVKKALRLQSQVFKRYKITE